MKCTNLIEAVEELILQMKQSYKYETEEINHRAQKNDALRAKIILMEEELQALKKN